MTWPSLVLQRSGGLCEAQVSTQCTGVGEHVHHRKLRSRGGGDTPANGSHVCHHCHDWIHAHPARATDTGWMVPSWSDPALARLWRYGRWVRLDDQGGMEPAS
ncbi:MAG: HNH endonuclease signature motif containing protein [Propionibacteriaceae bacterium]|nr:HNH endonuclease signature motif containing protein [Propionibacteriaceae bacterium]